jgi:hypothetical protein
VLQEDEVFAMSAGLFADGKHNMSAALGALTLVSERIGDSCAVVAQQDFEKV